jgi:hypothetical protein
VGAVRGAEGVVHVDLGERGELTGEARLVLLLPGMEAEVLEQHDVPRPHLPHGLLHLVAHAVLGEAHRLPQQLRQLRRHRPQAVARVRLPLGATEVGGEEEDAAGARQLADRRDRLLQPGRVADLGGPG